MANWDEPTSVSPHDAADEIVEIERNQAYLIVISGSNVGEMYKLSSSRTTVIGRGRETDIRVLDEGVSRKHSQIRLVAQGIALEDLGSRNGTYCNGRRIESQILKDGDKVQVGRTTVLKFTYSDYLDESFQRQMYDSALRDSLTKAFNRRYFTERLESEFRFADRHEVPLSLLLLDIDHFKQVNDKHGHLAGDTVLAMFATEIHRSVRSEDVFARFGGEEFAIISRSIRLDAAKQFAERLRSVIERLICTHDGTEVSITVSIGVATMPNIAARCSNDLIAAADRALYLAKHRGRNRVEVYPEPTS